MAKQVRSKKQARFDRAAIKKLVSTGLLKKADLRKAPTKYQRGLIRKFEDVIKGKAAVVKPADPKSYSKLFQVKGGLVIVPKHKGEKVKVNPKGNIVSERKVGGRVVRSRYRHAKSSADLTSKKHTMFFVPFIRGKDANGKPILEWKRFPNKEMLKNFMEGYDYKDWTEYVIEEKIDPEHPYTGGADLNERLNKKLGNKKRRRIRFADDTDGGDE